MINVTNRRIVDKTKDQGMQFGNFRYIFKQYPLTIWNSNEYINEIQVSTCDNIPVTTLRLNHRSTVDLYNNFINIIQTRDSFDKTMQPNRSNEISRIYGCFDFSNSLYKLQIEKEELLTRNTSVIVLSMDDDDFREFVFLFYFHFLISMVE